MAGIPRYQTRYQKREASGRNHTNPRTFDTVSKTRRHLRVLSNKIVFNRGRRRIDVQPATPAPDTAAAGSRAALLAGPRQGSSPAASHSLVLVVRPIGPASGTPTSGLPRGLHCAGYLPGIGAEFRSGEPPFGDTDHDTAPTYPAGAPARPADSTVVLSSKMGS
jgi:hypothetical protein